MGHTTVPAVMCFIFCLLCVGLGIYSLAPNSQWYKVDTDQYSEYPSQKFKETFQWARDLSHDSDLHKLYKAIFISQICATAASGLLAILCVLVLAVGRQLKAMSWFFKVLMIIIGLCAFAGFVFTVCYHAGMHPQNFRNTRCGGTGLSDTPCDSYIGNKHGTWMPDAAWIVAGVAAVLSLIASFCAMGTTPKNAYISCQR
eukprot:m51a1_g13035 hypothetical protein (200) ;mRNA; r:1061-1941